MVMVTLLVSGVIACQRSASSMSNTANDNEAAVTRHQSWWKQQTRAFSAQSDKSNATWWIHQQEAIKIDTANQQSIPASRFSSKP